jgi:hypothetical protein
VETLLLQRRQLDRGYRVQYDQKSADTRWRSYPPFFLANESEFTWRDLRSTWKCLLVEVHPQSIAQ